MKVIFEGTPKQIRQEAAALLGFKDEPVLVEVPGAEPAHPDYVAEKIPAKDESIKLAPGSTVVIQNNNPATPLPTVTPVVPTAPAKTYTLDDLITAAAPLLDAGKFDEMTALTRKYGADSFMAIKESDFGSVAADLRALGAKL